MERNIVKPLEIPGWQAPTEAHPEQAAAPPLSAPPSNEASRLKLEDWLPAREQRGSSAAQAGSASAEQRTQREPAHCPHCSARLSPIDVKLNVCMACHKDIVAALEPRASAQPGDFVIRL